MGIGPTILPRWDREPDVAAAFWPPSHQTQGGGQKAAPLIMWTIGAKRCL